jgi:hypothetical protein
MTDADRRAYELVVRLQSKSDVTAEPTQDDLAAVQADVTAALLGRWPRAGAARAEETAAEAVQRFMIAAAEGKVRTDPADAPGRYLRTIAYNAMRDLFGEDARWASLDAELADADGEWVFRLLDRQATRSIVVEALRRCRLNGDRTTVRVVRAWIRLAEGDGDEPSARAVAEIAGVSHPTVGACLERFRAEIAELI